MASTYQTWWESLSPQWQQAFTFSVLQKTGAPSDEEIASLLNLQVLRIAGPTAPHSNCPIELTDISGITALKNLQILILSHHAITGIKEVTELPQLKSLFVFNNKIESLRGVEALQQLEQLYVNSNELSSIKELEHLPQLTELFINDNRLTSFEGLTEQHADNLKRFVCLPNDGVKQKEILRVERDIGLRCR